MMTQHQLSWKHLHTHQYGYPLWHSHCSNAYYPMMNQSDDVGLSRFLELERSSESEDEEQPARKREKAQKVSSLQQSDSTWSVLDESKAKADIAHALLKIKKHGVLGVSKNRVPIIAEKELDGSTTQDVSSRQHLSGETVSEKLLLPNKKKAHKKSELRAKPDLELAEEQEMFSKGGEVSDGKELPSQAEGRKMHHQRSSRQSAAELDARIKALDPADDCSQPLHLETSKPASTSSLETLHDAEEQQVVALKKLNQAQFSTSNTQKTPIIHATIYDERREENIGTNSKRQAKKMIPAQERKRAKPRKSGVRRQQQDVMQNLMKRLSQSEPKIGNNDVVESLPLEMPELSKEIQGNRGLYRDAPLANSEAVGPLHGIASSDEAGSTKRQKSTDTRNPANQNSSTKRKETGDFEATAAVGIGGELSSAASTSPDLYPTYLLHGGKLVSGGGVRKRYSHLQKELTCKYRRKEGVEDPYEEALLSQAGPYDVLCDRNPRAFDHVGNRRFRITCQIYAPRYKDAIDNGTKVDRTSLVREVLSTIVDSGGRFLSSESGTWESVSLKKMKEKIGHAIRSAVTNIECDEVERVVHAGSEDAKELSAGAESLVLLGAMAEKQLANHGETKKVPTKLPITPHNLAHPTRSLKPSSVQEQCPLMPDCRAKSNSSEKQVSFSPGVGEPSAFNNVAIFRRQHSNEACRITAEARGHEIFSLPTQQIPTAMCIDLVSVRLRPQPRYPRSLRRTPRSDPTIPAVMNEARARRAHQQVKGSTKSRIRQAWESFLEPSGGDSVLDHSVTGNSATDVLPRLVSPSGQPQLPFSYNKVELQRQQAPLSLLAQSMRRFERLPASGAVASDSQTKKRPLPANYLCVQNHKIKSPRSKLPRFGTSPVARKITE